MTAAAALAPTFGAPMIVESDLLGQVAVEPEEIINFPTGLLGFPACREFVLLPSEREGMYWLQSVEHSPLAFVLVDPFRAVPGFAVDLGPAEMAEIGAQESSEVAILAIVTLGPPDRGGCTVNLQGPLAFNVPEKRAKQIAIPQSDFGVRYPIDLKAI